MNGSVWIVDDSPLEAEMARRALADLVTVEVFSDATSMLERLSTTGPPDVLILDWRLPGMSGIEVCRFVRDSRDQASLPILMLTVQGHKPDILEGLAAGANDYLTKPYDPAELAARVNSLTQLQLLTQQVRAERHHLTELFSNLPAYFIVCEGKEHVVRFINPAWRAGFVDTDITGHPLAQLDAQVIPASLIGICDEVYASSEPRRVRELPLTVLRAEGQRERGLFDFSIVPRRSALGDVEGIQAFAVEVTDQVEAKRRALEAHEERELLLAQAQEASLRAEQANRAKDEFLATVSHELRTPLNAILGWVSLLRSGAVASERAPQALETIERNARAQTKLIDDLLDVSRIVSGKLLLNLEPTDLEQVIRAAVEALRPAAEAKRIQIAVQVAGGAGSMLGDGTRLHQVASNLLTNAIKFTPAGGHVAVLLQADDSGWELKVTDDGQGIQDSLLPHIFDRFRQAETSSSRSHGGLGLGLAIVKHLVDLHGGKVWAASAGLGRGSTFTVFLPRRDGRPRSWPGRRSSVSQLSVANRLTGLRVLLVDDDDDGREVMAELLRTCGAEVTTAGSAREALEALGRVVPDVLVSDIGMPHEDGLFLIRSVRARQPDAGGSIPAIALSAYARAEDRTKSLMAGFNTHVTKPVELPELVMALANLTGRFERPSSVGAV